MLYHNLPFKVQLDPPFFVHQALQGPGATAEDVIRIWQTNKTAIDVDLCSLQANQAL